jgi:hypothetical protein
MPTTEELKALQKSIEAKLDRLVPAQVCEARTQAIVQAVDSQRKASATLLDEIKGLRTDMKEWVNLKLDAVKAEGWVKEVTDRLKVPSISPGKSESHKSWLVSLGENAKSLSAILILVGMLVTIIYYAASVMSVLRAAVDKQESLVKKQTAVAKEFKRETTPQVNYYLMPPADAGQPATKQRRRRGHGR